MKRALLTLWGLAVGLVGSLQAQHALIPTPVSYQAKTGTFLLDPTVGLLLPKDRAQQEALAPFLQKLRTKGILLGAPKAGGRTLRLITPQPADPILGLEGYKLDITTQEIRLQANQPAGFLYGMQTLEQLLPADFFSAKSLTKASIPNASIVDYPRFGWRGLMLDVSRHFRPKAEVLRFIDQMVAYKYNVLHWHLTDDQGWRVEIKKYPKLTEIGGCRVPRVGTWWEREAPKPGEKATDCGYYTQQDIREIVAYAQARNVQIIPEIDVPGHSMAAIAAYPELSVTQDATIQVNPGSNFAEWHKDGSFTMFIDNNLDPTNEKVYTFLTDVFQEISQLFPAQYIHLGGDECYYGFWEKSEKAQTFMKQNNLKDGHALQNYFTRRVVQIIEKQGKRALGWDEIAESALPPSVAVMSWRGTKGGIEAAKKGHDVVMSPSTYAYLDLAQGDASLEPPIYSKVSLKTSYSYEPISEGIPADKVLGGQGNLWSERLADYRAVEYMLYPRAWALSEVFWSPASQKNWENFVDRMTSHMARAEASQVKFSKSIYNPWIEVKKDGDKRKAVLWCEAPGTDIYYTLDHFPPDQFSTRYTGPIDLPQEPSYALRAVVYKKGKRVGEILTLSREQLMKR